MRQSNTIRNYAVHRPPVRATSTYIAGIVASLLLHALALVPLTWGGRVHRHRTLDIEGSAANQQDTHSADSMLVVFTEESEAIEDSSRNELLSRAFLLPQPQLAKLAHPRISAAHLDLTEDPEDRIPSEANGNEPGRSMLFGRYMGQITARVDRAWLRPRSAPASGKFACRAQITQDHSGQVQEVTLQECDGDPRWQLSLVRAINSASPFPAPPDPSVFSNFVTVEFDSDPYVPSGSEDGFEPASHTLGSTAAVDIPSQPSSAPQGQSIREVLPDGSVKLTIIGKAAPAP